MSDTITVPDAQATPSIEDDNTLLYAQDLPLAPDLAPQIDPGTFPQPSVPDPTQNPEPSGTGNVGSGGAVDIAKSYLGVPYVYGGNGRSGIDCSGLVRAVYKQAYGIDLPRISYQQANGGRRISYDQLQPGDLVAWDNGPRNPGADHIAVWVGGGYIIEAAHPGTLVRMRKLDLNGYDHSAWFVSYR